jgi:Tol biopolymer transport system component
MKNLLINQNKSLKSTGLLFLIFGILFSSCQDGQILDTDVRYENNKPSNRDIINPILFIAYKKLSSKSFGHAKLYGMNKDGSRVMCIAGDSTFPITYAAWSPDGNKIAVTSDTGGIPFYGPAIYIMNSDGSNRNLLTVPNINNFYNSTGCNPVWSPDSRMIAFSRIVGHEMYGNSDIFVINTDGTNERQLTFSFDSAETVWSWDKSGTKLYGSMIDYTPRDSLGYLQPCKKIIGVDMDGNYIFNFGEVGLAISSPRLSHSGKKITFTSSKGGSLGVYIMDLATMKDSLITKGEYRLIAPVAWSPDDTEILLNAGNWEKEKILIKNLKTGEMKDITPFSKEEAYFYAVNWRQ